MGVVESFVTRTFHRSTILRLNQYTIGLFPPVLFPISLNPPRTRSPRLPSPLSLSLSLLPSLEGST